MALHGSRRTALATLTLTLVTATAALPARAASSGHTTTVSLSPVTGTRQFFVEDLAGNDLSALAFGNGGSLPFRVRVVDQGYTPVTEQFSVNATLNNLYLGSGASHAFGSMVPSGSVSVGFGGSPLSAVGLNLTDLPVFSLSGTIPTCAGLAALDPTTLGGLTTDPAAAPLCAALGAVGQAVSGVNVTGLAQTVAPALSVIDAPVQLATGGNSGPFTAADFSAGSIGAGDTGRAAGAPPATARTLMTGLPGYTPALENQILTQLQAIVAALPLTTPTGTSARAAVDAVITALSASANSAVAQVGTDLATLANTAEQSAIVNQLVSTLVTPVAGDVTSVTGSYAAFPVLTATPANAPAGTYEGTMTVTFVQT